MTRPTSTAFPSSNREAQGKQWTHVCRYRGVCRASRTWGGAGCPFPTRSDFVAAIEDGASQPWRCSRDLKAFGLYASRSLSYDGVEYEIDLRFLRRGIRGHPYQPRSRHGGVRHHRAVRHAQSQRKSAARSAFEILQHASSTTSSRRRPWCARSSAICRRPRRRHPDRLHWKLSPSDRTPTRHTRRNHPRAAANERAGLFFESRTTSNAEMRPSTTAVLPADPPGKVEGCSLTQLEAIAGLALTTQEGGLKAELPPITICWRLTIAMQNLFFDAFSAPQRPLSASS